MSGKALLLIAGLAGLVWYMESSNSAAAPVVSQTSGAGTPPTPPSSSPTSQQYTGPSLAQMYAGLQSQVASKLGQDPALVCPPMALAGLGVGTGARNVAVSYVDPINPTMVSTAILPLRGGVPAAVAGGVAPRSSFGVPATCTVDDAQATHNVFNYYLAQAVPGIGLPSSPSPDNAVSLADYWSWAAPQLQAAIPGLAGLGAHIPVFTLNRPPAARSYMTGAWGVR